MASNFVKVIYSIIILSFYKDYISRSTYVYIIPNKKNLHYTKNVKKNLTNLFLFLLLLLLFY